MKRNIKIYFSLMLLGAMGLAGCQADMPVQVLDKPEASIKANTTIAELKTIFENKTEIIGLKDSTTREHYIIHGRVVSSDASGNIYKQIVIQDETAALPFSVNQSNMYTDYRLGQEVVVDMTDLWIGYYRGFQQIGWPGTPYNGAPQLGFMAYDYWLNHAEKNGFPATECQNVEMNAQWPSESMYCVKLDLPLSGLDPIKMQGQLVELRNVHFRQGGEVTYAPYQETVSRYLYNDGNDSIAVRNSGYSSFYNDTLPKGKGSVRGILGYYGDSWQLTVRNTADVMISDKGSKEKPYSVEEALMPENAGRNGWLSGYVVGSVKAGVSAVTSNDDIIFGNAAELDNNIVIADSPDVKDWTKCMSIALPQRSLLRSKANLIDNPEVYGKRMEVTGTFTSYLGMPGVPDVTGKYGSFDIEGIEITPPAENFEVVYSALDENDATCNWTFDNISLGAGITRVWSWKQYNGKYYLNGSAYAGTAHKSLSYAYSPEIDLSGKLEAKVEFSHAAKFQSDGGLRELCGFVIRIAGSENWVEVPIPEWPAAGTWNFASSGDVDISGFAGKKVQIGFKYESTDVAADTWEIKNLTVSAR